MESREDSDMMPRFLALLCRPVAAVSLLATAAPAVAAGYYTMRLEIEVETWPNKTWNYLHDFCSGGALFAEQGICIKGVGAVGSIRRLPDGTEQLLVAKGPYSYAYETITGPMTPADYHVSLQVLPVENDPLRSTIVATLVWNEEVIPESERLATEYRYRARIQAGIVDAKNAAEAS
jgi:hypothetical protein